MSRPAVHCMASLIATSSCTMDYLANWSIPSLTHGYSHRLYWGGSIEFCNKISNNSYVKNSKTRIEWLFYIGHLCMLYIDIP